MMPFDLSAISQTVGYALVFLAIGMAFGAVLEMAGFGDSRKLAAQFYFKDLTVLKVMFTAIIVAAVLLYLCSAFGWLDFSRVWVNPTYLVPGIVGGLIMGVGFIVGGFCPGTSLVSASTLKVDGILFVLGGLVGAFLFGESVSSYESFWLSSFMGRFTLPEWLGLPAGVTVLLVVLMALAMFWAGEIAERVIGQKQPWAEVSLRPKSLPKLVGVAALLTLCVVLVFRGQPTAQDRWQRISSEYQKQLDDRAMFVDPAEVVSLRQDTSVKVNILDLRSEKDFNLFHLGGAKRLLPTDLENPDVLRPLVEQPLNAVAFMVGNGEAASLRAWKLLKAQGVVNLYIIEGGVNRWLETYPLPGCIAQKAATATLDDETLAYRFAYATGGSLPSARPELPLRPVTCPTAMASASGDHEVQSPPSSEHARWPAVNFTKKVKLQIKKVVKGGCG